MRLWRVTMVVVLAALLAGCATSLPPLADPGSIDYVLGPGDRLHITVYATEEATTDSTINDRGTVATPIAGQLQAAGLTLSKFEAELTEALKKNYLRDPRIAVEILNYRPFYILGEVVKPGGYPYAPGLTVLGAVALGGGYSYRADTDRVVITRTYGMKEPAQGEAKPASRILPDDVIHVPERLF
jgi:protein involved in polysaccharide export with SLBB domain